MQIWKNIMVVQVADMEDQDDLTVPTSVSRKVIPTPLLSRCDFPYYCPAAGFLTSLLQEHLLGLVQGDQAGYREEPAPHIIPFLQTSFLPEHLPGLVQGDQASYREEPAPHIIPCPPTSPLQEHLSGTAR